MRFRSIIVPCIFVPDSYMNWYGTSQVRMHCLALYSYYVRAMEVVPDGPRGAWNEQGTNEFVLRPVFVPYVFVPYSYQRALWYEQGTNMCFCSVFVPDSYMN
jgi:hypothetical protein